MKPTLHPEPVRAGQAAQPEEPEGDPDLEPEVMVDEEEQEPEHELRPEHDRVAPILGIARQ